MTYKSTSYGRRKKLGISAFSKRSNMFSNNLFCINDPSWTDSHQSLKTVYGNPCQLMSTFSSTNNPLSEVVLFLRFSPAVWVAANEDTDRASNVGEWVIHKLTKGFSYGGAISQKRDFSCEPTQRTKAAVLYLSSCWFCQTKTPVPVPGNLSNACIKIKKIKTERKVEIQSIHTLRATYCHMVETMLTV